MESNGKSGAPTAAPDAPRGVFRVTVDEKGRLKLPAAIAQYLESLGERKVFITTLDKVHARIYPLSVWRETEKMLEEPGEDFELREDLALIAANYGLDTEIDAQGRVTLPPDLRKELGLEKDEVRLRCYQGRVDIHGSQAYDRRLAEAVADLPNKFKALQKTGL